MSELKSVNNDIISRESSKEIKQPDIIDDTRIQEVLNIFCKDLSKINSLDECVWTPLYRTIVAGDLIASHILILKGANPNIQCSMGETPLYQAVDMCKLDHVKLLINNGANPNIQQDDGLSPLHAAVVRQNLLIVKFLLKNGANPNIKSKIYNQTPVHLSIKNNGDPMIMLLLVQFNGSLLEKDKFDKRPIDYIRSKEMGEAIEKLKFDKNPKKLILLPLFQTPKKYKNWAISKVYSNTIRSNSSLNNDLNFNSNTVLKDAGNLKYNVIGTSRHDRYKKNNSSKNLGDFKNNKIIKKPSNNNINNEKNIDFEIDKENFEPNLRKRKLSFSIREESSCVESDKGDSFSERMNIKNGINNKSKNKYYNSSSEDINRLSNIIFSSKEIKENKGKSEFTKTINNFSKIPKNIPYTKSLNNKNHTDYISNKTNTVNSIVKEERKNYKFVQIYGNSKTKNSSFSLNHSKQKKFKNQSMDINETIEPKSERSSKATQFLYTKPILSLNELNAKKLNLSHSNINYNSKTTNNKNNDNNSNNKNSTIKKKMNNVKRLFTFMDSDNSNNNNQEEKSNLLFGNKNNENKSRNLNNDIYFEKNNNSNSNYDFDRKTNSISILNTNRNNTSILNDESLISNYIWKFKTIEDDNTIHNKKISGNTSLTTCSYNIEITNQNALYPIYEWLREINLECYYNLFIDKKIYNLDKLIYNLKNGICNISKNDMLKIGITTPGHIYRIITKLEIDSEKINNKISDFIIDKKNILNDGEINILKNSIVYCCGCCSLNNQSKYLCNNDYKKYQLEQWLSRIKMEKYKDNFINNGFDIFEYFILQMFSSIPIDENILKEELKIDSINNRDFILLQINKDIKYIIQKTTTTIKKNIIKNKNINDKEKVEEYSNCFIF